jgi:hypothetical protein
MGSPNWQTFPDSLQLFGELGTLASSVVGSEGRGRCLDQNAIAERIEEWAQIQQWIIWGKIRRSHDAKTTFSHFTPESDTMLAFLAK